MRIGISQTEKNHETINEEVKHSRQCDASIFTMCVDNNQETPDDKTDHPLNVMFSVNKSSREKLATVGSDTVGADSEAFCCRNDEVVLEIAHNKFDFNSETLQSIATDSLDANNDMKCCPNISWVCLIHHTKGKNS